MDNVAQALSARAAESPERVAMHFPGEVHGHGPSLTIDYTALTFGALESRSNAIALGLRRYGILPGARVVVMLRPSPEFFLVMFALFKLGAVPVLVDPGIDKRALRNCLATAAPTAFIGVSLAHAARVLLRWAAGTIVQRITVGARWFWGGTNLQAIEAAGAHGVLQMHQAPNDLAAILFTSGSTGTPKGVEYRHAQLIAQVELLRNAFNIIPGTTNLPTFPPFALFDPALGCTSVIPVMDPTRPARADPYKLLYAINAFQVGSMFGSPALLQTLANHCAEHSLKIPSLHTVMSAGAPVAPALVQLARKMLRPDAQIFTPYGATEALPVAVIEGSALLGDTQALAQAGGGVCVGYPLAANCVRIIEINDAPIPDWPDTIPCAHNQIGEITVRGPSVTERYFGDDEKTTLAKIRDIDGAIVHRMGDVGYFDAQGRLWYCGRKSHRVQTAQGTLFTEQIEAIFNASGAIQRCALVGVGPACAQTPVVFFELSLALARRPIQKVVAELKRIAALHPLTAHVAHFWLHSGPFPVDIRHNAKINREKLARLAGQRGVPPRHV
jgi:olefin beta-lactone synthetase